MPRIRLRAGHPICARRSRSCLDREKPAEPCDGALSAEEVVSERLRLHDRDADWAWICLTELWQLVSLFTSHARAVG